MLEFQKMQSNHSRPQWWILTLSLEGGGGRFLSLTLSVFLPSANFFIQNKEEGGPSPRSATGHLQ